MESQPREPGKIRTPEKECRGEKADNSSRVEDEMKTEIQSQLDDMKNQKGLAIEVIESMRKDKKVNMGMVEEITREQEGIRNKNMIFPTKYLEALFRIHAL